MATGIRLSERPLGAAVVAIVKSRNLLFAGTLFGLLAGLVAFFIIEPVFRAQARVLPPQVSSTVASNLMMLVGGSGDLAASAAGQKNPSELYLGILRSRSVLLPLIEAHQLVAHYRVETIDDAERRLNANLATTLGKDGIIVIEVSDKDAALSATLCNAAIEQMYEVSRRLASDERQRRNNFYAPWLADARGRLVQAESRLREAERRTGLARIKGQEESVISTAAELQSQITSIASAAAAMRAYATPGNPELQRVEAQLGALRARYSQMERRTEGGQNSLHVSLSSANETAEEVSRLRRDAKLQEGLLEIVSRIAELSKVDETRDLSLIKILDRAVAPTKQISPRRSINATLGAGVGFFIMFMFVLAKHQAANPKTQEFLREILNLLKAKS